MEGGGAGGAEGEGGGFVGWGVGLWECVLGGAFCGFGSDWEGGREVPWCVLLMFLSALAVLWGGLASLEVDGAGSLERVFVWCRC